VLNMMRRDGWLQPAPGRTESTKYFDYFVTAISGSKAENALHIKQVLGWKYLHPETWQLPCLALYGKGGAGKNLLAEKILPIIFGAKNCAKLMFKQVERFNESLAGKTVVFFDERPSREDESIMKFFIGQPTLSIEGKGHSIYQSDNTALYVLATNSPAGPVRIEKNGSERRWSFLKVKETLVEVFMRMEKVDEATAKELITWADEHVYGNPAEVAHFLNDCIEDATKLEAHPHALHSEDYDELLQTQSDAADDVMHDIFIGYDKFQDITHAALYATYLQRARAMNPGAAPLSSTNFLHRAMDFIMNNKLSDKIVRTKKRVNVKRGKAYTGKSQAYYSPKVHATDPSSLPDRTDFFTSGAYLVESPAAARVVQLGHVLATAVNDEDVADRMTA
jgi:phage/plasmid-associated DNA primase